MKIEEYIEKVRATDRIYHWVIDDFEKSIPRRNEIHAEFPHVIAYEGDTGYGGNLDDMDAWCREKFGDQHGKCYWRKCPDSFDMWYEINGFEEAMDKEYDEKAGPRPDREDTKEWDEWQEITGKIVDEHFAMIKERPDKPPEHSHIGTWKSHFVVKTGYDYGYNDYCFKNPEDAVYFKLMWEGEQK